MKKRRFVILTFLLCATLVIGIGYAAINKNLVTQTKFATRANAENFPLVIKDAAITKQALGTDGQYGAAVAVTPDEKTFTSNNTTIDIKLPDGSITKEGDKVVITVTIENQSDHFEAALGQATYTNTASDYIAVTIGAYGSSTLTTATDQAETDQTTVTITLVLETPPLDSLTDVTVSVTFPASAQLPTNS